MTEASLEANIGELLRFHKLTLSVAESCSGGLLGDCITNIAGSSDYFMGGVIAYDNRIKEQIFRVSYVTLKTQGAVSDQAAREMAEGVKKLFHTDIALALTGIAGPGGGTKKKPVGYTWIALSAKDTILTKNHIWKGNRRENKASSVQAALLLLQTYLESL